MTDIAELIARLEAATEGSRELDEAIALTFGWTLDGQPTTAAPYRWIAPKGGWHLTPPLFTESVDAAMSLVPKRGAGGLLWRIILERKPLHSGPAWIAEVREHAKNGGGAIAHTAALALCVAALKARSAS
jgi:hypothetical protein